MNKTEIHPPSFHPVVLYEDNHLIAINKKPSDIVQGDKTGDTPLSENVKKYLAEKYNKPGEAFIGVVHRLDRPVSGVVLFAKTSKALARMNELFKSRDIQKKYWAVVKNKPAKESDHLVHYLKKNEAKNMSKAYPAEVPGSLKAELKYTVLVSSDNYHLLEIELFTGRHHQIRAQLSAIGSPVKGDIKYGFDRTNKDASIHLHARSVEFIHPVKDEKAGGEQNRTTGGEQRRTTVGEPRRTIKIVADPPVLDSLWKYFLDKIS